MFNLIMNILLQFITIYLGYEYTYIISVLPVVIINCHNLLNYYIVIILFVIYVKNVFSIKKKLKKI